MKNIVILGSGTAGTIMANHLTGDLPKDEWTISIIDPLKWHYYQPGFLFVPFEMYDPEEIRKPIEKFIPKGVDFINKEADVILPEENTVRLKDGTNVNYDILIIATGSDIAPQETEGMKGPCWRKDVFDFYSNDGAIALRDKLKDWEGGHLVVHITEMPIKCPVAPLEFAFLADSFFKDKNMRDKVKISFVTPLSGAFTKPKATAVLQHLLTEKNIEVVPDFYIEKVDGENKKIVDYGGREVEYDVLVTIPTNMGNPLMERSGIGDDLNFVPTDKGTLQSKVKDNIFVIGDATDVPTSKAGSVAHFEAEILLDNIKSFIRGEAFKEEFDGHANCFIETGNSKAILIDFNYEHEPTTGSFPITGIGPMKLLKETRMNHLGKLAFKWIYWNMLLPGRKIPLVTPNMSKAGKDIED
ncbi:MAG: NAD(P)/FAD-dependent oxidoreductase [Bacteroidetes bacterium]|nr:MAG: NAD(P)/FAD-dependent oxidoreductase [Bacteroidota bacterium]